MATVLQILTTANPNRVAEIYTEAYSEDGWNKPERYLEFIEVVRGLVPVRDPKLVVRVDCTTLDWVHVGLYQGEEDTVYSASMTPWTDWVALEVEEVDLHPDELATHIYYEMTWHGWPDAQEKARDELTDQLEQFHRAMEAEKDGTGKLEDFGFTEWKLDDD